MRRPIRWVRDRIHRLWRELARFGTVGSIALLIDIGLSNLLWWAAGFGALSAKAISVAVATTFAFLGNRYWTWRHRVRQGLVKEYTLYFGLNGIGLLIALSVLWLTVYALGLDGPLARNISANVIGIGLGTVFRFWAYRRWVFLPILPSTATADQEGGAA